MRSAQQGVPKLLMIDFKYCTPMPMPLQLCELAQQGRTHTVHFDKENFKVNHLFRPTKSQEHSQLRQFKNIEHLQSFYHIPPSYSIANTFLP